MGVLKRKTAYNAQVRWINSLSNMFNISFSSLSNELLTKGFSIFRLIYGTTLDGTTQSFYKRNWVCSK